MNWGFDIHILVENKKQNTEFDNIIEDWKSQVVGTQSNEKLSLVGDFFKQMGIYTVPVWLFKM